MNLFKSISIYTIANFLKQGAGFFLLPIITVYLTTGQNGDLSTIMAMVTMLGPLIYLSSHGAINLEYFRKDHGAENYSRYVSSALVNPALITLAISFLIFIFAPVLSRWLEIEQKWLMMVPLLCFVNVTLNFTSVLYQARKMPVQYSIFNISLTVIDLLLAALLIISFSMNWEGRLWAMLSTKALFSLIGLYIIWRSGFLTKYITKDFIKDAFFYGLPLIPHVMSAGILDLSDRIFIREMVSREELGIYDIGYKIGSVILILQASILLAWSPFFYEKMKAINPRNKIYIISVSYLIMIGLVLACGLLILVAPLIFKWFVGTEFSGGIVYVGWVALAYVFFGFYKMFVGFIFYEKKNKLLSYIAIFNISLNLFLNYWLINKYGTIGAAYATVISYFAFFIVTAIVSQRIYPMPWFNFREIFQFIKMKYLGKG